MKHNYICLSCIEAKTGKSAYDLSVEVFNQLRNELAFQATDQQDCPVCGSSKVKKILGIETAYIVGYGYADKAGARKDMDLHSMTTDKDPYKEHRAPGESKDVIRRLHKSKEFDTKPKTIHLSK